MSMAKHSQRTVNNTELARRLSAEVERASLRAVSEKIGVSHGFLEGAMYNPDAGLPKLENVEKVAQYFGVPAYEVLRWAGFDPQLPPDVEQGAKLIRLAQQQPELRRIVRYLPKLSPDQVRSLLAYLQVLEQQREQEQDDPDVIL
jgi:hypothetical protein